jgi:alkanesulfonate monooxygenase SsuD/methylene tetrahydromethanopterin reductase-like flavin-dependent oxidoreductase (luciferase family)
MPEASAALAWTTRPQGSSIPDYGHPLEFGTFLTPRNHPPRQVVELAQLSERAGLDLVTFQDHPYQPAFHDTWTLIAYVAAVTDEVRLAANVHNLPLRQPAVLARAAAGLDLLTGGRIEMALGAGGFWDAIEAMGGPRRSPGEAVDALSEAIDVIRAIWDVEGRTRLEAGGAHHRVDGAKRGPEPAHDMQVWIGGYQPRMLGLIGTKADGWLPTFARLDADSLDRQNRVIDEAARQAGRSPSDIRRLVNISGTFGTGTGFLEGSPERWTEDLAPLVARHGFSTFILASDDPATIETFARKSCPPSGILERASDV